MSDKKDTTAAQGKLVASIIALTGVLWLLVQVFGARLQWTKSTMLLVDLFALAAFVWCLIVTYGIWRKRQKN